MVRRESESASGTGALGVVAVMEVGSGGLELSERGYAMEALADS